MKILKYSGWSLIGLGSLILLFLGYQLVFTNVLNALAQDAAAEALEARFDESRRDQPEIVLLPPVTSTTVPGQSTATTVPIEPAERISYHPEDAPESGGELGLIMISKIEVESVIVEGVDRQQLKDGPGHMPWTPLPGQPGNAVISGHRTTYGAPFFRLDELEEGDKIIIETVVGTHTYEIREKLVVQPTDVWVTEERPGAWLTLTTCNPQYSARQRLIIVAELIDGPNLVYANALAEGAIQEVAS